MHLVSPIAVMCGTSLSGPIFASCTAAWKRSVDPSGFCAQQILGPLEAQQPGQRGIQALAIRQRAHGGLEPLQPFVAGRGVPVCRCAELLREEGIRKTCDSWEKRRWRRIDAEYSIATGLLHTDGDLHG